MRRLPLVALPLLLVPATGLAQGGYRPTAWVWAGALAAWAAALGVVVGGSTGALGQVRWWVAAACALLLWTAASAFWSAEPTQSLLDARRTAVYAAFVLALAVLARRRPAATLVAAAHVAVALLVTYALARYLLGGRRYDPFEADLLSNPLGYANAVGILAAIGMLLALAGVVTGSTPARRAAAGATLPPLALALDLTGSDASWLALFVGLAATLALSPRPVALARAAAVQAVPAAAAAAIGAYSGLANPGTPQLGGGSVALAAVGCAGIAAAAAAGRVQRGGAAARLGKRTLVAAAVAAALVGAAAVASAGSSQPRSSYYSVAMREYRASPLLGSGAGTFGRYWLRYGRPADWGGALDAHSLYVETLAELGPVGLLLLAALLLLPFRHLWARRAESSVPFAAGAALAFLVHAGLDWDWEMPAVVLTGLAVLAALALPAHVEEPRDDVRSSTRARAVAFALAVVLGIAAIVGGRSHAEPAALSTREAPRSGASLGR